MLLATVSAPATNEATPRELTLATWNVENLFDAADDPRNKGDDEFTPGSWRTWTPERYSAKLTHLADVIAQMNADILCLQEIENRCVLENLVEALRSEFGVEYEHILHRDSQDHRGIDVAVLSKAAPEKVHWLSPVPEQREVLVAKFPAGDETLTVYVNHWKSRWGSRAASDKIRRREAEAVRRDVDALLAADPNAKVVVAGDFNDDCDGAAVCEALRATTNRSAVLDDARGLRLFNVHGDRTDGAAGTFYYRQGRSWNTFDTLHLSRGLLTGGGWTLQTNSVAVFRAPDVADAQGLPIPFRLLKDPKTKRWGYVTGYSDHFPLRLILVESRPPRP
jgi:endonuclease/exonuclease/phosphatase family metal-dependent hydrolase